MNKLKVGVVGATGMVGQRFLTILDDHPWFEVTAIAASANSAGKTYEEAVSGRYVMKKQLSEKLLNMKLINAADAEKVCSDVDLLFCAVNMPKAEIREMEERFAKLETPVISNNSACRMLADVPMMIPECNSEHMAVIDIQRKRLGTRSGFIACKPNCSIQSYVPALTPLLDLEPEAIIVSTYQAISGAGKTFERWPEILDNVIPFISGEEEKSEKEPLKIWGRLTENGIVNAVNPKISAQCYRVPVSDGHMASVAVKFRKKTDQNEILARWDHFEGLPQKLHLPSAPEKVITYFEESDRPQSRLDRDLYNGMGISAGRLREDCILDWKFACLSHNTLRGAAGGAVLTAEMLVKSGYISAK